MIDFDRSEKDHSSRFRVREVFTQPGSFPGITALQHCCLLHLNQQTLRLDSDQRHPERGHLFRLSISEACSTEIASCSKRRRTLFCEKFAFAVPASLDMVA